MPTQRPTPFLTLEDPNAKINMLRPAFNEDEGRAVLKRVHCVIVASWLFT